MFYSYRNPWLVSTDGIRRTEAKGMYYTRADYHYSQFGSEFGTLAIVVFLQIIPYSLVNEGVDDENPSKNES